MDASNFINSYLKENNHLDEMLSAELDVSNTNIKMNEMIDGLFDAYIESEKEIGLK